MGDGSRVTQTIGIAQIEGENSRGRERTGKKEEGGSLAATMVAAAIRENRKFNLCVPPLNKNSPALLDTPISLFHPCQQSD